MGFYVEEADRSYQSRVAAEDVHVGELVHENGSDKYERLNNSNHSEFDALAVSPRSAQYVADDEDVASVNFVYKSSEDDRVPALPLSDRDRVKIKTPEDTGGNESAANINDGDIVGVIDTSDGTLSSTAEYEGRVVQEGYTDGESTPVTYNRTNNNFLPIGKAYKDSATSFDDVIRVDVQRGL